MEFLRWGAILAAALGVAALTQWPARRAAHQAERLARTLEPEIPKLEAVPHYVTSQTCQSCHPHQHATWHRSFHRTMTQEALPGNIAGRFDGTVVVSDSLEYRVSEENGMFFADMPDPDVMMYSVQGGRRIPPERIPRVRQRVVMATGSHHYQTYWVDSPRYDRLLQTLPLVYLLSDQRWIPREAAFMRPPGLAGRMITQWNHHCIRCHSTAGNPGLDPATGMLNTRVAELGISCEACHGPAESHVLHHQNPLNRYSRHLGGRPDPTMVNPARLNHRLSSQVCGQCHGVYVMREEFAMRLASEGPLYTPGEDLDLTRYYIQHPARDPSSGRLADLENNPDFFRERWWDDGTILAGGREYSALAVSKCYTRGEMSCLSCHSMHDSEPAGQMKPELKGNQVCTQCHEDSKFTTALASHTFHAPESPGSECMNCHMPHTTYALFRAIRSHEVASPAARPSIRHGTPNACNLCHLDKTLAWTQDRLAEHYGQSKLDLTGDQRQIAASLIWLLQGNAAQRVVAAWHFGWEPARRASGSDWMAPFLAHALADPYGVIRYVAGRSLRNLPGFESFALDFLAPDARLEADAGRAVDQWRAVKPPVLGSAPEILLTDTGEVMESKVKELLDRRDNRPVYIKE